MTVKKKLMQNFDRFLSFDITGNLAANYPPPYVIARFCIFDSCQSYGAFSAFRSRGSVQNCYFLNCGRSAVVANDCAKLSISHCEFAQTAQSEQTLSSSQSDVSVNGCYFHAGLNLNYERNAQAVALTCKSVGNLTKNYFFRTGNGVSAIDADLTASNNLIFSCCQNSNLTGNGSDQSLKSTLGLFTGFCVKSKGNKVQLIENTVRNCDVGVYVGQNASPILKNNDILASFFTGLFAECQSRPSVVQNSFDGGGSHLISTGSGKGLGILLISGSCGLIGKNFFRHYEVCPVMVFSTCHPLLKDNTFENIDVNDEKQKNVEKQMLDHFQADLFKKDEFFYIVESQVTEKQLQEVILEQKSATS